MSIEELGKIFNDYNHEYLEFERIQNPPCSFPDLCGLNMLHSLDITNDNKKDMLYGSDHRIVYLSMDPYNVLSKITKEKIIYLLRCGILYDSIHKHFYIFT